MTLTKKDMTFFLSGIFPILTVIGVAVNFWIEAKIDQKLGAIQQDITIPNSKQTYVSELNTMNKQQRSTDSEKQLDAIIAILETMDV